MPESFSLQYNNNSCISVLSVFKKEIKSLKQDFYEIIQNWKKEDEI